MRIVWQSVAPWHSTGYGTQTKHVTQILKQLGHHVIISCFCGLSGSPITCDGIKIFPSDNWGANQTPYYYKEFNADILISLQDLWPLPGDYGTHFNWYPWTPIDHEPPPPQVLDRLKHVKKPIALSLNGQKQLKELGIDSYYIPHGVDTKVFKPGPKLDNFGDNFVVGVVGSNRGPRKNLQQAIIAFKKFHNRHKDSVFYLHTNASDVGSGINLKSLVKALDLSDDVFFPKQIEYGLGLTNEELARIYNSFDVFLLPSAGEGFGIPIIEAQACSIPVIVSDFTSMPELVGGGWVLNKLQKVWTFQDSWQVSPDIDEIVEYLEQAYQMRGDNSIKEKARKKALEYDWDKLALMWDEVLKDIGKVMG